MKALTTGDHRDAQPTAGIQRVVTRAVDHRRSLGRGTVTGGDLLLAMFDEKERQPSRVASWTARHVPISLALVVIDVRQAQCQGNGL
jgi:ATP-dependent Clp protease ATP-binding subunit ClpA